MCDGKVENLPRKLGEVAPHPACPDSVRPKRDPVSRLERIAAQIARQIGGDGKDQLKICQMRKVDSGERQRHAAQPEEIALLLRGVLPNPSSHPIILVLVDIPWHSQLSHHHIGGRRKRRRKRESLTQHPVDTPETRLVDRIGPGNNRTSVAPPIRVHQSRILVHVPSRQIHTQPDKRNSIPIEDLHFASSSTLQLISQPLHLMGLGSTEEAQRQVRVPRVWIVDVSLQGLLATGGWHWGELGEAAGSGGGEGRQGERQVFLGVEGGHPFTAVAAAGECVGRQN
ncbi:hypothetical protein BDK51DRAFT_31642 [Blyttiomyces helicus]|uniref:Uncharacterized protein n=1 Tax=Blyttiomyces helicus TaxID=388810 RepID=A0A4V1IQ69_9FUNG|nr:hypothetical protein BDK51DRAFT_31642 [Blyttiomyces helicus]|eukprot:RKO85517.1 hypothetical protein BDK51DRAFT_31642 [Blyttiomyces helicus]